MFYYHPCYLVILIVKIKEGVKTKEVSPFVQFFLLYGIDRVTRKSLSTIGAKLSYLKYMGLCIGLFSVIPEVSTRNTSVGLILE